MRRAGASLRTATNTATASGAAISLSSVVADIQGAIKGRNEPVTLDAALHIDPEAVMKADIGKLVAAMLKDLQRLTREVAELRTELRLRPGRVRR